MDRSFLLDTVRHISNGTVILQFLKQIATAENNINALSCYMELKAITPTISVIMGIPTETPILVCIVVKNICNPIQTILIIFFTIVICGGSYISR
jgi:hypothetical protein